MAGIRALAWLAVAALALPAGPAAAEPSTAVDDGPAAWHRARGAAGDVPRAGAGTSRSTLVLGDSITWQWLLAGGIDEFPGIEFYAGPGWQIDACGLEVTPRCETPLERVRLRARQGRADRIVWLLGTNDTNEVWDGGWNMADVYVALAGFLVPPEESCSVFVLPWLGPGGRDSHRTEVDQARAWLAAAANHLRNVHVVDWRPHAEPAGVLDGDGIHLAVDPATGTLTPEAYAARRDVIRGALAVCP